jgi:hypothetical protein
MLYYFDDSALEIFPLPETYDYSTNISVHEKELEKAAGFDKKTKDIVFDKIGGGFDSAANGVILHTREISMHKACDLFEGTGVSISDDYIGFYITPTPIF